MSLVKQLNQGQVEGGGGGSGDLLADGSVPLTANWDVGAFKITAAQLESDVAAGTPPLVVASTTKVTNLNADTVDGVEAAAFYTKAAKRVLLSVRIPSPAVGVAYRVKIPAAVTITEIAGCTDSGTADFNVEERAETTPNTAGTDAMAADLQATSTQAEQTSFANAGFAANTWMTVTVSAVSSGVNLDITVMGTID